MSLLENCSPSQDCGGTKVAQILTSIWNIPEGKENDAENPDDIKIEDTLFLNTCEKIALLSSEEFRELEDQLFIFILTEWEGSTECCFKTLTFIVDIFVYISKVADEQIVSQYVNLFSKPAMPPHVQLILCPAVVKVYQTRFSSSDSLHENPDKEFFDLLSKHISKQDPQSMSIEAATELTNFWKYTLRFYLQAGEDFDYKLLAGFLLCRDYIAKVCENDDCRITMFKSLAQCLIHKPSATTLLLATLLVNSLQFFKFTTKSWMGLKLFLEKTVDTASHHRTNKPLMDFVTNVVSRFIECVHVPQEMCIYELKSNLQLKVLKVYKTSPSPSNSQENVQVPRNASPSKTSQNNEKMLELLEKLVKKMKTSSVNLETLAEKERLKVIVADLTSFI